jgi:pimeloyl-ACP methyl ester carboxylesterase
VISTRAAASPKPEPTTSARLSAAAEAYAYQVEFWRRSVLLLDTLRVRANNMLAHEQAGLPPLLNFDYEIILDARRFEHPANYALLRITGCGADIAHECERPDARPVIIIDPRAGHGPGIGGFKRDSEVGMALHEGHPTYFVIFYPEPCPGQTLADVLHALRRFVEEVSRRHQGRPPTLYGNCQAGWAVALLAATHEGLLGPAVLNGSPLSYWAGASDVNPMRLAGGLLGGTWLGHFVGDLGDGRFDGAWLVQNFENLNPANTLWEKNYKLFANIDGERERFLEFERWWTGFYFLSQEEMVAIVENLFIGDRLEQGKLRICEDCVADLKAIHNPLVIFASSGDNITPPHQALNWVPAVYPTTEALKSAGQRIVYLLNSHVGHLGIFVSADVAKFEHRAILESLEEIEQLRPGLYEMKIDNPTGDPDCRKPQYSVRFEPRNVEQIRFDYPRKGFERVREVSEANEAFYKALVSPWVRAAANPLTASQQKWLHPMRLSRYLFSERLNPWMVSVAILAPHMPADPRGRAPGNPWMQLEQLVSQTIVTGLEQYRKLRDHTSERQFAVLYGE